MIVGFDYSKTRLLFRCRDPRFSTGHCGRTPPTVPLLSFWSWLSQDFLVWLVGQGYPACAAARDCSRHQTLLVRARRCGNCCNLPSHQDQVCLWQPMHTAKGYCALHLHPEYRIFPVVPALLHPRVIPPYRRERFAFVDQCLSLIPIE